MQKDRRSWQKRRGHLRKASARLVLRLGMPEKRGRGPAAWDVLDNEL
jgi:hypothetical protein